MATSYHYKRLTEVGVFREALRAIVEGGNEGISDELAARSLSPEDIISGIQIDESSASLDGSTSYLVVTMASLEVADIWNRFLLPSLRRRLGEDSVGEILVSSDVPERQTKAQSPAGAEGVPGAAADVRLPSWVSQAGLRAFRPFIAERPTQWRALLPRSRAGVATVVVTRTSGPGILGEDRGLNRWSLFWGRGSLYEIDLGLHHTEFEVELPSQVDMFSFRARVAVEWRVRDPVQVVRDHVWDVREVLRPALVSLLKHDTRIFRVDQVFEAERAVAVTLHGNDIGKFYGLETNLRVQLSADPGAAAQRRAPQQKIEIGDLQFGQRRLQETSEEHIRQARIRLYRDIIEAGDVEQFALQLARNLEEVTTVVQMVREVRQEDHRQVTSFLTTLLDSGAINRWEANDAVQAARDWLNKHSERVAQIGEARIPWMRADPHVREIVSLVKPSASSPAVLGSRQAPDPGQAATRSRQPNRRSGSQRSEGRRIVILGLGDDGEAPARLLAEALRRVGVSIVEEYGNLIGKGNLEAVAQPLPSGNLLVVVRDSSGGESSDFGLGYLAGSFKDDLVVVAVEYGVGIAGAAWNSLLVSDVNDSRQWQEAAQRIQYLAATVKGNAQPRPCLITHHISDSSFVSRLAADLDNAGLATYLDPKLAEAGEVSTLAALSGILGATQILILSKKSMRMSWAQAAMARGIEIGGNTGRTVVLPVVIDDVVVDWEVGKRQVSPLSMKQGVKFRDWRNPDSYYSSLRRLAKYLTLDAVDQVDSAM